MRNIEVTDEDLKFALASVCDSQEEADLRFEKKIFGGLVMQAAEDHARTRCEDGGVARQREMCDIPPAGNALLQTTTMINTIASGS